MIGSDIIAGTGNGVFVSANNGNSWTYLGLSNNQVSDFYVNGTSLFAGTLGNGLYISDDNGKTWNHSGPPKLNIQQIVGQGDKVFICTLGEGVYKTTDNGKTLSKINYGYH